MSAWRLESRELPVPWFRRIGVAIRVFWGVILSFNRNPRKMRSMDLVACLLSLSKIDFRNAFLDVVTSTHG